MTDRPVKRVSDSRTEQVHILMPEHINGAGRLFGGRLMEWIDVVAGVAARRHAGRDVTTASVDHLVFQAPASVNSTIAMTGAVTSVGNTSMEVRVDTYVESLDGVRERVNRAYLTLVALDEFGRPAAVPALLAETDEEKREMVAGEARRARRKEARHE